MIDTVFNAVSDIVNGAGSLIEGIFVKQPSQDELKKQVRTLQASVDTLENSFKTQNDVIDMLLAQHGELKFYQFNQKASLQTMIENELVTQYAALDYFTILLEAATSGQRMAREDFEFFKTYSKMLQDGRIDSDETRSITSDHEAKASGRARQLGALRVRLHPHSHPRFRRLTPSAFLQHLPTRLRSIKRSRLTAHTRNRTPLSDKRTVLHSHILSPLIL